MLGVGVKESPLLSSVVVQCSEIVIMDDYIGNLVRGGKSIFVCFGSLVFFFAKHLCLAGYLLVHC